ncbi:hypothetical protein HPB47_012434 [Ixodes persulcatus]|uniref:Uncharacterized protein n=1 Tax=Ixodes persulcatus TaxID=34615 RepID=A0AC60NTI8_IXOPE|nr:hypothetical protein HPB47_012434 [Ixodes persulcatus]
MLIQIETGRGGRVGIAAEPEEALSSYGASHVQVQGYPTLVLFKDGKRAAEFNGARDLEALYEFVEVHLGRHDEL